MLLRENCIDSTPRWHVLARGRLMAYCGEDIRRMAFTMTATGIREEMAMNWSRQRRQLKVRHNFQFGSCSRFCNPNPFSEFVPRIRYEAASHVKGTNNVVEDNQKFSISEQCSDISKNSNYRHVSSSSKTKSTLYENPDSGNGRQSDERNSNTENGSQAESGDVGLGDSAALKCNGRNGQDIPLGRKRRWWRKRKKNAYAAGIAIYDSHTNSVRLKESVTETPTQCVNLKQQRQRNPTSSKRQLTDQRMQSVEAKAVWQASSPEEVTECACELYSVSRSNESFLGIGEAARLSGLVVMQETGNTQPTIESDKGAPNQECAADVSEVVLKRIRGRKSTEAFKASNINGFDQNSQSAKKISQTVGLSRKTRTPSTVDNGAQQQPSSFTPNRSLQSMFGASLGKVDEQVQQVQANASFKKSVTTADQVAESKSLTSNSVTESVTIQAAELSNYFSEISEDDVDMKDEFESNSSDRPEFLGLRGLNSYKVLQDDQGILVMIRDFYFFMMKQPLPNFSMGMIAGPLALSMVFTLLYLPEFHGLAYDETARDFLKAADGNDGRAIGLKVSWMTVFQVFMFSLSLSTGLQPDLAPLSPYTLVVANLNALIAQLILAFLSAAVFARLSQPSQPVRCSSVALIYSLKKPAGQKGQSLNRCVLAGPQPCELINVKVDLTYKSNMVSSVGSFLSSSYCLKLVRSQVALLDKGMTIRHIIDATSPLYSQTPESLCQDDAIFVLSVAGMERSSMQPISHVQFYSVCDDQVIWNADFEDMILINKNNQRVVDHSKLSCWKPL
ncbi:uncharacterized protein [Physcomitrium patens]|uniref:Inward rectifier potassium channel C-terminal domain-containing protein n=1 Tax=Physcomitrium patens TaxID=3218 RepID=A0A2K1IZB1_PHYPA|nr:uncharacterized protein LOC112272632 isoform X2 [Physcomitrium patens]PNR34616.1 hypothetical protein PHYPA_024433 [Physcomitrium patens]|eukprot:XP_024356354.1 uncharacterized protein LOC112272632 isoform X2 [Physcomitrella patens]